MYLVAQINILYDLFYLWFHMISVDTDILWEFNILGFIILS